jgi:hypothetical protein
MQLQQAQGGATGVQVRVLLGFMPCGRSRKRSAADEHDAQQQRQQQKEANVNLNII